MSKWPAMNERERQQLEIRLRNKRADLDGAIVEFRAANPLSDQSAEDSWAGVRARRELDLFGEHFVAFARGAFEIAMSISICRKSFEIARDAIKPVKERFEPHIVLTSLQLSRLKTDKTNSTANQAAIRKAASAIAALDRLVEEAEFDFALPSGLINRHPNNELLDEWIRECGTQNSKEAWRLVRGQSNISVPSKVHFDERWKLITGSRPRGRPRTKNANKED
jgi:hypothetical protein